MTKQQVEAPARMPSAQGQRSDSEGIMEANALVALDSAIRLAQAGDRQGARQLCAAVISKAQPLIAARRELFCATLHALLVAHGFKQLSRLVMAISGRSVQIVVLPEHAGLAVPPRREGQGYETYALDPNWLTQLSPDDAFLQWWCNALTDRRRSPSDIPAVARSALRLEPA